MQNYNNIGVKSIKKKKERKNEKSLIFKLCTPYGFCFFIMLEIIKKSVGMELH